MDAFESFEPVPNQIWARSILYPYKCSHKKLQMRMKKIILFSVVVWIIQENIVCGSRNWVITACQDVYLHKNLTGNPRNKPQWVNRNENFEDKYVRPSGGFDIVDVGNVSPSEGPLDNEQPEPFGESWGLGDIWYIWMIVSVYQKLCENWICCPTH